jgi:hypothetical protein
VTQSTYRQTLKAARRDLETLYRQREELERKIARLRQTVISLGALTKETPLLEKQKHRFKENESLTEAVMNVIQASEIPLHPKTIQERLEELGYDIGSSNPLASIWSVVRRLEQKKSTTSEGTYLRWYKQERSRIYGRSKTASPVFSVGVWWGDQRPRVGEWERYDMGDTPKQRRTKDGPIAEEE